MEKMRRARYTLEYKLEALRLVGAGQSIAAVAATLLMVVLIYALAVQWFVVRNGLGLSRGRTALLVFGSDLVTGALVMTPQLLMAGLNPG